MSKVYLSPSNQVANMYAGGLGSECDNCNKIADAAKAALERCGIEVKKAPPQQDMAVSIRESNAYNPDLHICIHTNAYNGQVTGGTLVMLYSMADANAAAGAAILRNVAAISPGSDYGLRANSGLAELNSTKAIAVYCEVEFHDTLEGAQWITSNYEAIGDAIAKGCCEYFGIPFVAKSVPAPIPENDSKIFRVQVGAFANKGNADKLLAQLKSAGFEGFVLEAVK